MNTDHALLDYTLRMADDALVMGQRLGEWCGHGPILEQDIALTNTALDHLGRARSLYQYAAEQVNRLPGTEKQSLFQSVAIRELFNEGKQVDEDSLAYLRDAWDYRNHLLTEQPNNDWAFTTARSFFYDVYNYCFFSELVSSNNETISAIAEKSLKEITYHMRWSSEWVIRLGDGTDESHRRMQDAVNELWMYTGELFRKNATDEVIAAGGIGADLARIAPQWLDRVTSVLREATIVMPSGSWMQHGGKDGTHSEHLGYILADLQFLQRAYPGMQW